MTVNVHLHWDAEALWQQLQPLLPGLSVEVLARAELTNTVLLERARVLGGARDTPISRPGELDAAGTGGPTPLGRRDADVQPCLLVAEQQTRGRGRQGRNWVSSTGASLTFSLALPLAPADWSGLSLAVGLALAEALEPLPAAADTAAPAPAPRLQLKWPNDLWIVNDPAAPARGRKLGGILIETVSVGQRRMCVVGVGLNVLPQPVPDFPHGYASLQELHPGIAAPAVLARVAEPLVRALLDFQARGFAPLVDAYARRDLLRGQAVTTTQPDVPAGVADGVNERGALRVLAGGVHLVVSGEVSVRLDTSAAA